LHPHSAERITTVHRRKALRSSNGAVGYRQPPKSTRFKKGKSGNPKGRPRGSRGVSAVLRDVIRQKISVTENGKTRRVSALEVMLRRLANDAMRNDPRALKLILSLVDRYVQSSEVESPIDDVLAEDQEILARYLGKSSRFTTDPTEHSDDEDCR
jgi:hypothetical protein